ncbi:MULTISPECIES: LysR family transcriptional regulator [unclassified Nocardioides]|uniref:LysR substrate-binding domain-containing protein n=1 Tax=unclassified Nocardioides TaxID=2615069 RepID=UPI0010564486|nr:MULTISPECIES: LysR family transcriptional regulator [unclassified Nocardioides]
MDGRQLEYVIVLADTLHFGRAAERMCISQSAFSTQIARLEREVGAMLFDRSANRVSLTPAGEAFLARARKILDEVADASAEARTLHAASQGILRVGLFCDSAGELTQPIISAFRRAYPEVELSFRTLSMTDLVEPLASNEIDVEFLRPPVDDPRLKLYDLFADPRVAAVPTGHELASLTGVRTDQLLDHAFAVAVPNAPSRWRAYWACDDARGEPGQVAALVNNIQDCLNAIAHQGAVDTFPLSLSRFQPSPGVAYRPLLDGGYSTNAVAARRTDQRVHVQAFVHIAQQLAASCLDLVPDAVPLSEAASGTPGID